MGGGSGSLSSSGAEDARQGGKEEVTGKSKRGVRGIDSELRGVLPARGVLEPSEKRRQKTVGEEAWGSCRCAQGGAGRNSEI